MDIRDLPETYFTGFVGGKKRFALSEFALLTIKAFYPILFVYKCQLGVIAAFSIKTLFLSVARCTWSGIEYTTKNMVPGSRKDIYNLKVIIDFNGSVDKISPFNTHALSKLTFFYRNASFWSRPFASYEEYVFARRVIKIVSK